MRNRAHSGRMNELRKEYDFRGGIRGKYAARVRERSNIVVLDADVAAAFPNSSAVNRAGSARNRSTTPVEAARPKGLTAPRELRLWPRSLTSASAPPLPSPETSASHPSQTGRAGP